MHWACSINEVGREAPLVEAKVGEPSGMWALWDGGPRKAGGPLGRPMGDGYESWGELRIGLPHRAELNATQGGIECLIGRLCTMDPTNRAFERLDPSANLLI